MTPLDAQRSERIGGYFASMCAQDLEGFVALFADDGVIIWPDGRAIAGMDNIRAAYAQMFSAPSNTPSPGPIMFGGDCCATEVHSRLPDGNERRTTNVFHFGTDGLITKMSSYRLG
jgi:hypothetical protein